MSWMLSSLASRARLETLRRVHRAAGQLIGTDFHSPIEHLMHTGSRPWCGVLNPAGHPPTFVSLAALLCLRVMRSTVTWRSHSHVLRQCKAVPFPSAVPQPGTDLPQLDDISQTVSVHSFTNSTAEDCIFLLCLDQERP